MGHPKEYEAGEESLPPYDAGPVAGSSTSAKPARFTPSPLSTPAGSFPGHPEPSPPSETETVPSYEKNPPQNNNPFTAATTTATASTTSFSSPPSQAHGRHIAIPQVRPGGGAPLLTAYPPSLLRYGVTSDSFRTFVDSLSSILSERLRDRVSAHTADLSRDIGRVSIQLGRDVGDHAKSVGVGIKTRAREHNYVGAVSGGLGGLLVSVPLRAALAATGAMLHLPAAAAVAAFTKPKTPRQRADEFLAQSNATLFRERGLHAHLADFKALAPLFGPQAMERMHAAVRASQPGADAGAQLDSLRDVLADLEIQPSPLQLGEATLWLVFTMEAEYSAAAPAYTVENTGPAELPATQPFAELP